MFPGLRGFRLPSVLRLSVAGFLAVSVCSSALTPAARAQSNVTLTIWGGTASTYMAGLATWEKANPDITVKQLSGDIGNLPVKILLYNRLGAGWPDVTFDYQPENIASYITPNFNFPLDLTPYVSKSVLANYATGANALCMSAGHLYCLRNDLGQDVLWYNTKLMKQFGYSVPTTWEQYEALGLQVAKQHPGYVIGTFDPNAENTYFQPSQCPAHQLVNPTTVRINVQAPQCVRVATMLDTLIKAGSVAKFGIFSKDMAAWGRRIRS